MKRRAPGRIELAAQVADLDVDDIGLGDEFEIPHVLEQHRPGHDLAGAAHEIFEQGEFPRQQIDRLAVALYGPLDEVHFQRAGLQSRLPHVAAPAQERFDARRQFADVERLDQVVVAAGLQPIDPLVDRRECADHQGRRGVAFGAQRLDDREAILAMQHPIDDQNRGARARRPQRLVHGLRKQYRMAARLQFEANLLGKVALIFDHQDRRSCEGVRPSIGRPRSAFKRRHAHGFVPRRHTPRRIALRPKMAP